MKQKSIEGDFGRGRALWHEIGSPENPRICFLGANGHAASTYNFFLARLADQYFVEAMECRAVWPSIKEPEGPIYWSELAMDYDAFLHHRNVVSGSLIHIGHSLGGSLGVMQALARPELFKALVVIEPGSVPSQWQRNLIRCLPFSVRKKIPFIKGTIARQSDFFSKDQFMQSMRAKRTYANFCEDALLDYAEGGLVEIDQRYRLKYSSLWEGTIFCDAPYIWPMLLQLKVPTLLLRAEHTYLQSKASFERFSLVAQRKNPCVTLRELPGVGHMAVQENPEMVRETISSWLHTLEK